MEQVRFRSLAEEIADLRVESDILASISRFSEAQGFKHYLIAYVNPDSSERPWFVLNYDYLTDEIPGGYGRDPLLKRIRSKAETFAWDASLYHSTGNSDIWEAGRARGIYSGISSPLRPGGKRRLHVAMMRDREFDGTNTQLHAQCDAVEQYARMICGTVVDFQDSVFEMRRELGADELEAMKWVFDGYGEVEVAMRMNISPPAARKLLQAATTKLGKEDPICASITAVRLGLIGQH